MAGMRRFESEDGEHHAAGRPSMWQPSETPSSIGHRISGINRYVRRTESRLIGATAVHSVPAHAHPGTEASGDAADRAFAHFAASHEALSTSCTHPTILNNCASRMSSSAAPPVREGCQVNTSVQPTSRCCACDPVQKIASAELLPYSHTRLAHRYHNSKPFQSHRCQEITRDRDACVAGCDEMVHGKAYRLPTQVTVTGRIRAPRTDSSA